MSRDLSEITLIYRFAAQQTFLIIINVENSCAALIFSGKHGRIPSKMFGVKKGYITLIKCDNEDVYNVTTDFLFKINVLLNFPIHQIILKNCINFHKILSSKHSSQH